MTAPDDGLRAALRTKISNAYYEARNDGGTMETAADNAVDGVLALLAATPAAEPGLDTRVADLLGDLAGMLGRGARSSLELIEEYDDLAGRAKGLLAARLRVSASEEERR